MMVKIINSQYQNFCFLLAIMLANSNSYTSLLEKILRLILNIYCIFCLCRNLIYEFVIRISNLTSKFILIYSHKIFLEVIKSLIFRIFWLEFNAKIFRNITSNQIQILDTFIVEIIYLLPTVTYFNF
jgi:hypothetical protein